MKNLIITLFAPKVCATAVLVSLFVTIFLFAINFNHYVIPYTISLILSRASLLAPIVCYLGIITRTIYLWNTYSNAQKKARLFALSIAGVSLIILTAFLLPLNFNTQ